MFSPFQRIPVRRLGEPAQAASPLAQDEQFYQQIKRELLADFTGQFALIYQQQLIDVFPEYQVAFDEAIRRGLPAGGFLIKEIAEQEPVETI